MNAKNANKSTLIFFNICVDVPGRTNVANAWMRKSDHLRSFADQKSFYVFSISSP